MFSIPVKNLFDNFKVLRRPWQAGLRCKKQAAKRARPGLVLAVAQPNERF
jgi:hypothetical protein